MKKARYTKAQCVKKPLNKRPTVKGLECERPKILKESESIKVLMLQIPQKGIEIAKWLLTS